MLRSSGAFRFSARGGATRARHPPLVLTDPSMPRPHLRMRGRMVRCERRRTCWGRRDDASSPYPGRGVREWGELTSWRRVASIAARVSGASRHTRAAAASPSPAPSFLARPNHPSQCVCSRRPRWKSARSPGRAGQEGASGLQGAPPNHPHPTQTGPQAASVRVRGGDGPRDRAFGW